jgi:branched-chain amino acid aminotransferase
VVTLLAEDGYRVQEATLTRTDVYYAEEAFFTGTAAEVTPIREVDGRVVGEGKPGPITRRTQDLFMGTVTGRLTLHPEWLEHV